MPDKFFEAGKTYIENDPYRAPEALGVFKVEWVGTAPDDPQYHVAMGFTTEAYPGAQWRIFLDSATQETLDNRGDMFDRQWAEAVWDTSQKTPFWRQMVPGYIQ